MTDEKMNRMPASDGEALWLSSVKALQNEPEAEPNPGLSLRIKAAVEADRQAGRVHRIKFPLIASSVAAAALVALLVIPGLLADRNMGTPPSEHVRMVAENDSSPVPEARMAAADEGIAAERKDGTRIYLAREEVLIAFAAPAEDSIQEAAPAGGQELEAEAAAKSPDATRLDGENPEAAEAFLATIREDDRSAVRDFLDAAFADQMAVTIRSE